MTVEPERYPAESFVLGKRSFAIQGIALRIVKRVIE